MTELIRLVRVYDIPPLPEHSVFLVDRLWPRGIAKSRLPGVVWLKDVAPGHELRRWFHANPVQWDTFVGMYRAELRQHTAWQPLVALLRQSQPITLLYGSRDKERNHAMVLRDFLIEQSALSECG
ncbi:DUF488 domain-containing protein [Dickeya solani]|uniref:DUF488 family protein n=2 Tax=Dickeya solani TaxID=1089444 RepID=A0ABU4EK92_9GAMM|nr:DUF488 family protein [Dickeya solani]ANE74690.1 MarR family transcriptional regulator [Dickeya solani IPO 2222]AUC41979.1 putative uroporphyrin-III c-methyltransferase [Dickeya solani RNS 08.23.3.1.A]AUH09897.1 MarR family transcriptional regulator [Dickeya solani D s0432-1]AUH13853.1 MarR family transcriptional regulator [Dickeya solani]AYQ49189.1 hypothetical protein CTB91_03434 [Dickeya solani]